MGCEGREMVLGVRLRGLPLSWRASEGSKGVIQSGMHSVPLLEGRFEE